MKFINLLILLLTVHSIAKASGEISESVRFFNAADPHFQYTGRVDFSNATLPRFWAPGVYIKAGFVGNHCEIVVNDEVLYGKFHNYISVIVDDFPAKRIKLTGKVNRITVAERLPGRRHTLIVCKSTESNIGYLEFAGVYCNGLFALPPVPNRRIEFIGNSITCGTGSDLSNLPCGKGEWYDQHNAYMSYGPLTARALNSQWQLTAFSGIGLIKSCCELKKVMPQIFDKVDMNNDTLVWDFNRYQPDVVTVCLGQNDGVQDSSAFCSAYLSFISHLRLYYANASIICISSPMADEKLFGTQQKYLQSIVAAANSAGDNEIFTYFFSRRYHNGCGDHPDLGDHHKIADELTLFIRKVKRW